MIPTGRRRVYSESQMHKLDHMLTHQATDAIHRAIHAVAGTASPRGRRMLLAEHDDIIMTPPR
jgi:hypothetical protein